MREHFVMLVSINQSDPDLQKRDENKIARLLDEGYGIEGVTSVAATEGGVMEMYTNVLLVRWSPGGSEHEFLAREDPAWAKALHGDKEG